MKRICVLTGTRSEYGLLRPVMQAIKDHPDLELLTIVAGMHLSEEFGYSVNEIANDGFEINAKVEMNPEEDSGYSMAKSIGIGVTGMADVLQDMKPDVFLAQGDRIEPLAGVIAAAYMNIPIAHTHGGDVSGTVDEPTRHAITKYAHVHFAATEESAERILRMGEEPWRVHVVGGLGLDTILNIKLLSKEEVETKFNLDMDEPLILMVQHSIITEAENAGAQAEETLEAIKELGLQTVIIYPNSDAGGREIIEKIKEYEYLPFVQSFKSLSHKDYLSLMRFASVIVGNSSSGIIESSCFKIPAVNVGSRQEGRQRTDNVLDASHDRKEIIDALRTALEDEGFKVAVRNCKNPYGEGKAGKRIAKVLSEIVIDKKLIRKKLTY